MKKTIYLHIGMPKTGTSSIQRFLYENRLALEKKGVLYPPVLCKGEGIVVTPPEEIANLKLLFLKGMFLYGNKGNNAEQILRDFWNKAYLPLINASSASIVVLSAEELLAWEDVSYVSPLVDILSENFDVKVIAYLRRPAEYIVSLWGELVKTHRIMSPVTFPLNQMIASPIPAKTIPYSKLIYLVNLIGAENVIVKPFEKCQFKNGNLIDDFLDIINIERDGDLKLLKPENDSYGRNSCELALLIGKLNLPFDKREELHLMLSSKDNDLRVIETLSDESIEQITRQYSATLKSLASIYNKDSFFTSDYPDCYKKERPAYDNVVFSLEELKYLHEAVDNTVRAHDKYMSLAHTLARKAKPFFQMKYFAYRILCNFVPKGLVPKYKAKRDFYKMLLH